MTRKTYHHGALREELLAACLNLVQTEGLAAVSLRRVAREAGVSPGAPYHHFPDRAALLAALAARGFTLLADTLVRSRVDDPVGRLRAIIDAYVDFAEEQPGYFGLMFRPELYQPKPEELQIAADRAFDVLTEMVDAAVRAGAVPSSAGHALAITIWGLGHGLASLLLDGQLAHHCAGHGGTPREVAHQATELLETLLSRP